MDPGEPNLPRRQVVHADALVWLEDNPASPDVSVVTSLPDVSEMGMTLENWKAFFVSTATRIVQWIPDGAVAVFYQSDIRLKSALVDKSFLIVQGVEAAGGALVWHKIVCRAPPGTAAHGRPSYSHMIAAAKCPRSPGVDPGPDVIADAGLMSWSKAMGVEACRVAIGWIARETSSRVIVDPFCGRGTTLAVANELGLDAIGVDLSAKRCRAARTFRTTA
jgi:hypothetical protein